MLLTSHFYEAGLFNSEKVVIRKQKLLAGYTEALIL